MSEFYRSVSPVGQFCFVLLGILRNPNSKDFQVLGEKACWPRKRRKSWLTYCDFLEFLSCHCAWQCPKKWCVMHPFLSCSGCGTLPSVHEQDTPAQGPTWAQCSSVPEAVVTTATVPYQRKSQDFYFSLSGTSRNPWEILEEGQFWRSGRLQEACEGDTKGTPQSSLAVLLTRLHSTTPAVSHREDHVPAGREPYTVLQRAWLWSRCD